MKAHSQVPGIQPPYFRALAVEKPDGSVVEDPTLTCSHCGSLTIDDALKAFETKGMRYAGLEWQNGIPYAFALTKPGKPPRKFCSVHMLDATEEQMLAWNVIVMPLVGVGFAADTQGVRYGAEKPGHQAQGVVS
jgi:hypothetical protein